MLRRLTVENYALIDKLDMELDAHLNIITGETGAGKSILLGMYINKPCTQLLECSQLHRHIIHK